MLFSKSRLQFTNKLFEEHDNIIQATENRFQQETEIKDGEIRYLQRQVVHLKVVLVLVYVLLSKT